ncbi:MAG: hypothetical protein LBU04_01005 [Christensenellaceae bacterium]|jgi:hypothetical protein|nr:hypothetical protein [Christensenellaceae bacterium]
MEYDFYNSYRLDIIECGEFSYTRNISSQKFKRLSQKLDSLFIEGILGNDDATQYILSLLNDDNVSVKTHVALKCVKMFCIKKYHKTKNIYTERVNKITFEAFDKIIEILMPYLDKSLEILKETVKKARLLGLIPVFPNFALNEYCSGSIIRKRPSVIAKKKDRE